MSDAQSSSQGAIAELLGPIPAKGSVLDLGPAFFPAFLLAKLYEGEPRILEPMFRRYKCDLGAEQHTLDNLVIAIAAKQLRGFRPGQGGRPKSKGPSLARWRDQQFYAFVEHRRGEHTASWVVSRVLKKRPAFRCIGERALLSKYQRGRKAWDRDNATRSRAHGQLMIQTTGEIVAADPEHLDSLATKLCSGIGAN